MPLVNFYVYFYSLFAFPKEKGKKTCTQSTGYRIINAPIFVIFLLLFLRGNEKK